MRARRAGRLIALPWWFHSRVSSTRRIALVAVAAFEAWEVALLWSRGFHDRNGGAVLLGFVVLVLLLGFELAEHVGMKRDADLSREISDWLLPRVPPLLPGVDVAFRSRPAERVASDYFNVFPRAVAGVQGDPQRVFVVMADVAGTGVEGALLMATFQASLRALADAGLPIEELATQMNRWSWDRSLDGRHFTMAFFADYDGASGGLRYVSAGHQPPYVLQRGNDAVRLEVGGLPLGVASDTRYETGVASLEPGGLLVIASDGALLARDHRNEPYGRERLEHAIRAIRSGTAGQMLNVLDAAVLSFGGSGTQLDDISFLVLGRRD